MCLCGQDSILSAIYKPVERHAIRSPAEIGYQKEAKQLLNQSFKIPRAPRYNQNAMKTIFCESANIVAFNGFPLRPCDET